MDLFMMSESLVPLRAAFNQLADSKVTQKKKGLETIRKELMKERIQRSIDEASKKKYEVNWNSIFSVIQNYVYQEAENIRKMKVGSATSARKQEKEKKELGSIVKFVIKVANARGENIKCEYISQYILKMLSDEFYRNAFGEDTITILCKNVLRTQKYVTRLKQQDWNDLIKLCTSAFMNPSCTISKDVLSQTIHALITEAVGQCIISNKLLFRFFLQVIPDLKHEKSRSLASSIIAALNTFSRHTMANCRRQLCQLGEHVLPTLLHIWNRNPSSEMKDQLIEFMQIQLTIHHPLGATTEQKGAYANDPDTWKLHLKSLYKAIYEDIRQTSNKAKLKNTSGKDFALDDNLVYLATDVFYQMLTSHADYVFEMTQVATQTQVTSTPSATAPKRRRIVCGWNLLLDILSEQASTLQGIAWLQVFAAILNKYPESLPKEELSSLLNTLLQARLQCKRSEVQTWLLQCLSALAVSQKAIQPRQSIVDRLKPLWNKVWSTTSSAVRSISPHGTQYQAYNLLSTLLTYDLVTVDKDQWRLFIPGITKPTRCLAICLRKTSLPENYQALLGQSFTESTFPLRCQLLQWLISLEDNEDGGVSHPLQDTLKSVPADLLADVLVSLVEKSPSIDVPVESKPSNDDLQKTAELYLETDFICHGKKDEEVVKSRRLQSPTRIHEEVLEMMMDCLSTATNQLILAASIQESTVEYVLLLAVLIQKVIMGLIRGQIMTHAMMSKCKLYKQFKKLLQSASDCLSRVCRKRDSTEDAKQDIVSTIISTWTQLYPLHTTDTRMSPEIFNVMAKINQDALPSGFIDHLFKIKDNEILLAVKQRGSFVQSQVFHDPFGDDNQMDIDMPDSNESYDDGFGDVDTVKNNNKGEDNQQFKACQDILSDDSLLAKQHLPLKCLRLLASYSCQQPFNPDVLPGTSSSIVGKLIQHLEQEDKSTPFGLQSCLCVTEILGSSHTCLNESNIAALLNTLRQMASLHCRNQKVCTKILTLISSIMRHLFTDNNSEDMEQAKLLAINCLSAFRKLNNNEMYTAAVRMEIVKCVGTLIQLDPESKWSIWQQKSIANPKVTFSEYLLDPDHRIQILVAHGTRHLFQFPCKSDQGTWRWFSKDIQNSSFEVVFENTQKLLPQQDQSLRDSDEFINKSSALLHTFGTIAKSSVVSQKKAVYVLAKSIRTNGLLPTHINKVLSSISTSLDYPSPLAFLLSHLGFMIYKWLDEGYPIFDFPYKLLQCNTKAEFFTKYHQYVIPYLLLRHDNLDDIKRIANEIKSSIQELLQEDYPQCIVHILPMFVHVPNEAKNTSHSERRAKATASYKVLEDIIGKQEVGQLMQRNLDTIVIELLLRLHDPDIEINSGCSPEPSPPYYLAYTIQATLDYITSCYEKSQTKKTLISLLSRKPDSIQNILLSLQMNLQRSHCNHEKQRLLVSYRFFVTLLLKEFHTGLVGGSVFVLHDTIHTLLLVMSTCSDDSSCLLAVVILHQICQVALDCCHQELGKLTAAIVRELVPLANQKRNTNLGNRALTLLNLLTIEGRTKLANSLQYVDPLSDVPCLNAARNSLIEAKYKGSKFNLLEEINHFLVCNGQNNNLPSLESLKLLHQKLAKNHDEMKLLLADDQETIGNLITSLVNICRRSGNDVQQQAAYCLGEIGPVDLCTLLLKSSQSEENKSYATAVKVYEEEPHMIRRCIIIHSLKTYLTDTCIETKQAAVDCLKCLLSTQSGIEFRDDYLNRNIDQLFDYLHPFTPYKQKRTKLSEQNVSDQHFADILSDPSLWQPESTNHEDWIRQLTCALIDSGGVNDEFLRLVKPVCKVKVVFAEQILAFLIHDILIRGHDYFRTVLSNHIQSFFARHCGDGNNDSRAPTPVSIDLYSKSKHSTLVMLQAVHYLRTQQRPSSRNTKSTAWDNNFWLDLDYLVVAMAAKVCSAHFTCILYTEIWCDQQRNCSVDEQMLAIESLSCLTGDHGINVQQLLLDSYCNIGEPDGIYGYGAGRLTDTSARIHTYEHEGKWMKALSAYDSHLQQDSSTPVSGLLQGLKNVGLHHVMDTYMKFCCETGGRSDEVSEVQYEAAWRLGQWDSHIDYVSMQSDAGFHEGVFKALAAMKTKDDSTFRFSLEKAEGQVLNDLCHVSLESNQNVYPLLCQLQMLMEIQNSMNCVKNNRSEFINESWKDLTSSQDLDFEFVEPVLAIRSSILDIVYGLNPTLLTLQDVMSQHLLCQSELARNSGRYHIAERAIMQLAKLNESRNHADCRKWVWQLEKAKMFWGQGEHDTAKHLLKNFIGEIAKTAKQTEVFKLIYPQALGIYGQWLAETHTASPNTIMDDYLEKAVNIYDVTNNTSTPAIQAYLSLARFADTHYQNICSYMKSKVFADKQALLAKCRTDLESLQALGDQPSKYRRTLEKQKEIDETEVRAMEDDKANYLHKAVNWYLKCLTSSDENDIRVFRVCSLWFDNANDPNVNRAIELSLNKLESRKFLPLMYQLAARMTTKVQGKVTFHQVLNEIIRKTVIDHPHHTLPVILALANANKDTELSNKRSSSRRGDGVQTVEERMKAAQNLLEDLKSSSDCSNIIRCQDKLSFAYIKLAYLDVSMYKRETKPIKIPSNQPIVQIRNLVGVAVPTLDLPIDPTCNYNDIVYVSNFESTFKLAGGVNLPKILTCIGSNGQRYTQLVKGRDDLRQDAVMQQVFGLVNSLLLKNPETRKRKLHVRRYKVIPLSQRSGLLEWCAGTMPLGQYLTGNTKPLTGAHKRYRPNDWTALECRKKMANTHDKAQKYAMFQQVMRNFKPVFRYFFMEKFVDPNCWFERRLAYTRSVATSSIVGYIVGLGDRHVQNILIDCNTAELIHIDLGVAFEQGKILMTPETVPFRLTRDIEDGMGVARVEGVFRRCCEKTMEVMHNSHEALLTILEVLLYDPLYDWTISPLQARNIQQTEPDPDTSMLTSTAMDFNDNANAASSSTEKVNKMAKRVLLRLRQKLQGEEDGVVLSVRGQVSRLIQEARDVKNLAGLFPGWQPWL